MKAAANPVILVTALLLSMMPIANAFAKPQKIQGETTAISKSIDTRCTNIVSALEVQDDEAELLLEDCVYSLSDIMLENYGHLTQVDVEQLAAAVKSAGDRFVESQQRIEPKHLLYN